MSKVQAKVLFTLWQKQVKLVVCDNNSIHYFTSNCVIVSMLPYNLNLKRTLELNNYFVALKMITCQFRKCQIYLEATNDYFSEVSVFNEKFRFF